VAQFTFEVQSYSVWLGPALGYGTLPIAYPAMIICWSSKTFRCQFRFAKEDPLPDSRYNASTGIADIFVFAEHYPWYLDLLRNERPVQCTIDTSNPKWSRLSTGQEPAGEGEIVVRP
jgi:hypothetical protein